MSAPIEYRPRISTTPTLASGAALPAEVTSDGGATGIITASRMAGNGETYHAASHDNTGRGL